MPLQIVMFKSDIPAISLRKVTKFMMREVVDNPSQSAFLCQSDCSPISLGRMPYRTQSRPSIAAKPCLNWSDGVRGQVGAAQTLPGMTVLIDASVGEVSGVRRSAVPYWCFSLEAFCSKFADRGASMPKCP
uniref:Uncharacterized protein n=1 Tax=Ralstonia solanacearum TaxID=305 RepID=A0A0S4TUN5_RALSL|nr:protein of unknown function [Ralstonia solanacearum]